MALCTSSHARRSVSRCGWYCRLRSLAPSRVGKRSGKKRCAPTKPIVYFGLGSTKLNRCKFRIVVPKSAVFQLSASQAETVQSSTALPCHHEFKNLGTQHCWRARAPEKKNELSRRKPFGVGSSRFRFEAQLASFNSPNIRKERVKGLLLMAASLPGFFYILQVSDQHSWQTFTRTGLAVIGLLYLSSVNLFVLGLMLLLAGLKGLSVLGERRLKRASGLNSSVPISW